MYGVVLDLSFLAGQMMKKSWGILCIAVSAGCVAYLFLHGYLVCIYVIFFSAGLLVIHIFLLQNIFCYGLAFVKNLTVKPFYYD